MIKISDEDEEENNPPKIFFFDHRNTMPWYHTILTSGSMLCATLRLSLRHHYSAIVCYKKLLHDMSSNSNSSTSKMASSSPPRRPTLATNVAARTTSAYPPAFHHVTQGREKRALGDCFGLTNFGVNHTTLPPGAASALQHCHKLQDEFIFIVQGSAVLLYGDEEIEMNPGDCMGFPAGEGIPHSVVNKSKEQVLVYLEMGDRTPNDEVTYASADLKAVHKEGKWSFVHKDGSAYTKE